MACARTGCPRTVAPVADPRRVDSPANASSAPPTQGSEEPPADAPPAADEQGAAAEEHESSRRADDMVSWYETADAMDRLRRRVLLENNGSRRDEHRYQFRLVWLYEGVYAAGANTALIGAFNRGWDAFVAGTSLGDNPYDHEGRTDRRRRYNSGFLPAFRFSWQAGWAWAERLKATDAVADLRTWAGFGVALPRCLETEAERTKRANEERP